MIGNKQFHKIFIDQDFIIAMGVGYESGSPQSVFVAKLDSNGTLLQQNFIVDSLNHTLATDFLWGHIYKTSQANYIFPAIALNRDGHILFQINQNLQVASIFEYQTPNDYNAWDHAIIELDDGGFLISGYIVRQNYKGDGFLRRLDKNGQIIWFKYYGDYNKDESFRDMVKISDNRFVLCGSVGPNFNDSNTARAGLWVVDSNGAVQQTWVGPETPDLIVITGILQSSDGGFIAHGRIYSGQGPWGSQVQVSLMKFTADLELEWLKPIGPTTSNYNTLLDMTRTPDGHYLVAGERTAYGDLTQPSSDWGGWLFKFTEQGDSLWARADNAPAPYTPTGEFVYGGVGLLSSGSIVAGGKANVNDHFAGWLVKVTPDGCLDTLYCQTSAAAGPAAIRLSEPRVYPNPSSERVQIELPQTTEYITLAVYSLSDGRRMLGATNPDQPVLSVDVSGWPAGLYVIVAGNKGGGWSKAVLQVVR